MKKQKVEKKISAANIIINGLIILFTLLIIFFACMLVKETIPYVQSRKEYDELQQFILPEEEVVKPSTVIVGNTGAGNGTGAGETASDKVDETGEGSGKESGEKVMREATCPMTVDFDALWKVNPDVKGWIYLEALGITYPVVKGETNDDYIYTSVKGTANSGGSIFMDYRNSDDFLDPHTLIYGHNMKDGSMFGKLKKLYDQEFVDEWDAPLCFWIITPEGKYRFDIFSIHTVSASGDTYTLFTGQGDVVAEYINKMARQTGVELPQRVYNSEDKVITLSTCTSGDEYRLVVQGVLHVE